MEFEFTSDHLALDFAGTLMYRDSSASERLVAPLHLVSWTRAAQLVDNPLPVDVAGLASALELREAIFGSARAVLTGARPTERDRCMLNRYAEPAPVKVRLLGDGRRERHGDLSSVLSTLSRSAIDLICGEDRERLRGCVGDACTRLFIDRSHAGTRRWCGMKICGSKVKSAAYRRRQRADS